MLGLFDAARHAANISGYNGGGGLVAPGASAPCPPRDQCLPIECHIACPDEHTYRATRLAMAVAGASASLIRWSATMTPIPVPVTNVGAGATVDITVRNQVNFDLGITWLFIDPVIAADFRVTQIRVGQVNAFGNSSSIPGSFFAGFPLENNTFTGFPPVMVPQSVDTILSVTNTSAGALDFEGVLLARRCMNS